MIEDLGDLTNYDIKIIRTGKETNTMEYYTNGADTFI